MGEDNNGYAVMKLLRDGANVSARNQSGEIPLHWAVQYDPGNPTMADLPRAHGGTE